MTTATTGAPSDDDDEVQALVALSDPAGLLVDALLRVRQADTLVLGTASDPAVDDMERAIYRIESANTMTRIAQAAAALATQPARFEDTEDTEDEGEPKGGDVTAHVLRPWPVQGVRFTATLTGRKLGVIGNEPWLWVPGVGFISGAGGLFVDGGTDDDNSAGYTFRLAGRVVSSTPDQALCVTDGGVAVALPHDVVVASSEDDR